MADSIELRASVTSIKRVDPYVKDILATATQVALYKFNTTSNEWEKTDKEGALFIYSRNGEPFHSIMIVNRLNKDNFIEPIVKNFDYQMQAPFLLYRNSKSKIFGIWFFNSEECVRITLLVETLMERFKDKSGDGKPKQIINKNSNGLLASNDNAIDIFAMLSKAQEDFNKTPVKQESATFASTPRVPEMTPQSVMDFFAKAGTKTNQKPIATGHTSENVLHRLMSNPAHSVEHIEKQQRSVTPQEQTAQTSGGASSSDRRSAPINLPSKSTDIFDRFVDNGFKVRTASPQQQSIGSAPSPLAFLMQNNTAVGEEQGEVLGSSPFAKFLENSQKPLLMTPMMFTAPNPASVSVSSAEISRDRLENVEMLTEKQLAQALIYLLKNNKDFIKQVHQAYINSIMDKVSSGSVDR